MARPGDRCFFSSLFEPHVSPSGGWMAWTGQSERLRVERRAEKKRAQIKRIRRSQPAPLQPTDQLVNSPGTSAGTNKQTVGWEMK